MKSNWLKDAIIYHILVDRFSTGIEFMDRKHSGKTSGEWMGGNLRGIIKKFNYIKELGINTIYLSPIYQSAYYHGYHVTDYREVDLHFGEKIDLKRLVDLCHKNNIQVILDFVPNHCSNRHPFFVEAQKNRNNRYKDWFVFTKWPNEYLSFLDVSEIPKLNLDNPETREYMISVAEYWIRRLDIDGYRLDHAIGPSFGFWREFKKRIKKLKKDFVLIGEVWFRGITFEHNPTLWLMKKFSKNNFEAIMRAMKRNDVITADQIALKEIYNMNIFDGCLDFVFMETFWNLVEHREKLEETEIMLEKWYKNFDENFNLITVLSNHDRGRFLYHAQKVDFFELFSSLQFTLPQPPMIYYGDEIGLSQESPVKFNEPFGDLEARRFMIWEKDGWNVELLEHFKKLCNKKKLK